MRLKGLKKILVVSITAVMAFSLLAGSPVSAAKGNKEKKKAAREVDLNGTYHATLGVQTCTMLWITRMGYYAKEQNEMYGTKNADKIFYKDNGKVVTQPGTLNDVEIKGNGTYTVSLDAADFGGEKDISQLHVATDIPVNDKITFSNVSAEVNGRKVASFDEAVMENEENYLGGGMVVLVMNHWRAELVKHLEENGLPETAESGYALLNGSGEENISITFTVSGFDYDNEAAQDNDSEEFQSAAGIQNQENGSGVGGEAADIAKSTEPHTDAPVLPEPVMVTLVVVLVAIILVAVILIVKRKKK